MGKLKSEGWVKIWGMTEGEEIDKREQPFHESL